MRSKKQKKLSSFMVAGSEANHHYPDCREGSEGCVDRVRRCIQNQPLRIVISQAIVFSLLFVLLFACPLWATTYYVKNGGNDSLAGTSDATAWATIAKVQAAVKSGDTVYFREGHVWTGTSHPLLSTTAGVTYYGLGYGTTGTRAKLQSSAGTTYSANGVINIDASDVTVQGFEVDANQQSVGGIYVGLHTLTNISDIVIDNCVVHDIGGDEAMPTQYYYGIIVGQAHYKITSNVTIMNCEVYRTGHEGISLYPGRGVISGVSGSLDTITVRGCTIHDTGYWGGTTWGHGLDVCLNAKNVLFEYNTIYNTGSAGIAVVTYADNPSPGYPNNVTIRYNYVYNTLDMTGIALGPQNNSWTGWGSVNIYGNILYNGRIYMGGGNFWNAPLKIYNNTVYNTVDNLKGMWIYETAKNTSNIEIKNNIIYTGGGSAAFCIDDYGSLISDNKHSNNLYYRTSGALVRRDSSTSLYTSSNINTWESTAQNANPIFAGGTLPSGFVETSEGGMVPDTNYFTVKSGNAVYNGMTLGSPYNGCINWTGSANVACRQAGAYDIGAYQTPTVVTPVPRTKISRLAK
ncbi:MAG: right-handed parallel beta-helix repeat-containing protein [Smithella sp.]